MLQELTAAAAKFILDISHANSSAQITAAIDRLWQRIEAAKKQAGR
jgi:sugar phosphate isomerase/epimerase